MSKVELYETIRRQRRDEGASIHELARRHGVHRRTVREALACVTPQPCKTPERASPALGPYKQIIRGWLEPTCKRRVSSGTPPDGCGSGWSTSMAPKLASPRSVTSWRRSKPSWSALPAG